MSFPLVDRSYQDDLRRGAPVHQYLRWRTRNLSFLISRCILRSSLSWTPMKTHRYGRKPHLVVDWIISLGVVPCNRQSPLLSPVSGQRVSRKPDQYQIRHLTTINSFYFSQLVGSHIPVIYTTLPVANGISSTLSGKRELASDIFGGL